MQIFFVLLTTLLEQLNPYGEKLEIWYNRSLFQTDLNQLLLNGEIVMCNLRGPTLQFRNPLIALQRTKQVGDIDFFS